MGRPMLMALRKKMRAKELATTAETPAALMLIGATWGEEPQPKLDSATMTSPRRIRRTKLGSASSMQCLASSAGSAVLQWRGGGGGAGEVVEEKDPIGDRIVRQPLASVGQQGLGLHVRTGFQHQASAADLTVQGVRDAHHGRLSDGG